MRTATKKLQPQRAGAPMQVVPITERKQKPEFDTSEGRTLKYAIPEAPNVEMHYDDHPEQQKVEVHYDDHPEQQEVEVHYDDHPEQQEVEVAGPGGTKRQFPDTVVPPSPTSGQQRSRVIGIPSAPLSTRC